MIDNLNQHLMRSHTDLQRIMYIPSDLPYRIASSVLRQGMKCDALARLIRQRLPEFLEELDKQLEQDMEKQGWEI